MKPQGAVGVTGVYVGDAAASAIGHPVVDLVGHRACVGAQLAHLGAVALLALQTPTQKQRIQRNGSSIDFMRPVDEEGWFNLGHVSAAERSLNGEESVGRLQHQSGSGVGGEVFDAVHLVAERALDGLLRCPVCLFFLQLKNAPTFQIPTQTVTEFLFSLRMERVRSLIDTALRHSRHATCYSERVLLGVVER